MIVAFEVFDRLVARGAKLMVNTPAGSNCLAVSLGVPVGVAGAGAGWVVVVTFVPPFVPVVGPLFVGAFPPAGVFALVPGVVAVGVAPVVPPVPVPEPVLPVVACCVEGVPDVRAGNTSCVAAVVVVVVVLVVVVVGGAVMVMVCCVWVPGRKVWLPGWLALSVQVPAALKLTTPPLSVHTELLEGSAVMVTGRFDDAVAVGV